MRPVRHSTQEEGTASVRGLRERSRALWAEGPYLEACPRLSVDGGTSWPRPATGSSHMAARNGPPPVTHKEDEITRALVASSTRSTQRHFATPASPGTAYMQEQG